MTWDAAVPAGGDNISLGDDVIREMKGDLEDALSADGVFPGADTANPKFVWTGQRGATSGRPSSPATGQLYFNTQLFQLEYWDGASWTGYDLVPLLAITAGKLAADAVTTVKIVDANVTAVKLATDAVETDKIKALAVTTAKIALLAITNALVNDVAASKITGTLPVANGGTGMTTKILTTGQYTGNGTSQNVAHGLSATPDFVIVADNTANGNIPVLFITGMGSSCHQFNGIRQTNAITGVDGTNISMGANNSVNQNTVTYSWVAFKVQ